ncbi:thiamine pyrophosphate-requiring protein [Pacificimonas sp. ICDLI1SI03]
MTDRTPPPQRDDQGSAESAGTIFLRRLAENGVRYFFANAGTDFAPVIEAIARGQATGEEFPQAVVIPHESAAIGMAHGYYLATGEMQAVMVHTNVGLANAVMGMLNAASDQIPILLASGITPVMDTGPKGHRTSPIAWGQNMRDQFGLVRDTTKWDGMLVHPDQTAGLVDRACAAARSEPRGPVYLGLPREVLCANVSVTSDMPRNATARISPNPADLDRAAAMLDAAETPLIVAQRGGGAPDAAAFRALGEFAERYGIPVVEMSPTRLSISGQSSMHAGFNVAPEIGGADLVLVLDTIVPWMPHRDTLKPGAKVIQCGADPYHLRTPVRDFPADVALTGQIADIIAGLSPRMSARDRTPRIAEVTARLASRREQALASPAASSAPAHRLDRQSVSHALARLVGDTGTIFSELGADAKSMHLPGHDQFFQNPIAGGLGWSLPAALGFQLADRERLVVATMGEGGYMFANPVACHQVAEALKLPVLTVVFNNGVWRAVESTSLAIYPDSYAARANTVPLTSLEPVPDLCKVAEASRAWTARVEDPATLDVTLAEAARIIRDERRQALIEVMIA